MSDKIKTPVFRASFVHLTEPRTVGDGKPKYQITIVLPKNDPFWTEKIVPAMEAAAEEKFGQVPANFKKPVKDGNKILDDDGNMKYPEFDGCYTLQASTEQKPDVCDRNLEPIMVAAELYSGAYYRASIRPYAWNHPTGGKGVSFALDNVMKVEDGDPLSGRGTAADDFAEYAEDAAQDASAAPDDVASSLLS